jgi:cell division protease FtsH
MADKRSARPEVPLRRRQLLLDRVRLLTVLSILTLVLSYSVRDRFPWLNTYEALWYALTSNWWLLGLLGFELLRQLWYWLCERLRFTAKAHAMLVRSMRSILQRSSSDMTRFRISRYMQLAVWMAIASAAASNLTGSKDWWMGLIDLPGFLLSPSFLPFAMSALTGVAGIIFIFYFVSRGGYDVYMPGQVKTRFSDVWGQDHVVTKVKETVIFLEKPEQIERRGGHVPGGILLWGPPGTGKTLLAEAVAGETGKPFVFVEPGAFQAMFIGVGVMKVKALFRKLRKLALRHDGVVVFFDEADSLGKRRGVGGSGKFRSSSPSPSTSSALLPGCASTTRLEKMMAQAGISGVRDEAQGAPGRTHMVMPGGGGGGDMGQLQALLTEMSGLSKPRGFFSKTIRALLGLPPAQPPKYRILVMMATNMPDSLDDALLRPGRVDRIFRVGYPSGEGRLRTYRGYLAKVRHTLTEQEIVKLSSVTPYATGASIKDMINEAVIASLRDGRDSITWTDLMSARRLRELGPGEGVEYLERERHAVAIHEACHAVVSVLKRNHLRVDIATISKGGTYLGMVSSVPPNEQFTQWKSQVEADIMVALASLVGERMFFQTDSTSGVAGDLVMATRAASLMESEWGMGNSLAALSAIADLPGAGVDGEHAGPGSGPLGARVEARLQELYKRTEELLHAERHRVLATAHALEVHRDLDGQDVEAVVLYQSGPVVDGRLYADPRVQKALEEYHSRAVHSHFQASVEPLELPDLSALVNGSGQDQ